MVLQVLVVELLVRAAILLLGLLVIGLSGKHDAQIVLGMLEIALSHHDVAGGLGIAAELEILVGDGLSGAADLHVRPVALIHPAQRVSPASAAAAAPTAASAAMAVAIAVLVSGSHRNLIFQS